jgi:cobalt-zinc-cadmium efflux system protein
MSWPDCLSNIFLDLGVDVVLHRHDHAHDHGHSHGHGHRHGDAGSRALFKALGVTLTFMVIEAVGGYLANSLALVSDAAHMLTDAGALSLSLFVVWLSRRPSTPVMSFGYHRVEILGALGSGLAIWVLAGYLVYEAVQRMSAPPEVQGPMVFAVATAGLIANLISMRFLNHSHESLNVRAAYLHVLSDLLGSVGAMVAGIVLWTTGWRPIDPIVTVVFSALMLFSSWDLVKESLAVLMESAPGAVNPADVKKDLAAIEGVREVHDLHIWSVSSGRHALSAHLISDGSSKALLARANAVLQEKHGIRHTTIQIEHPEEFKSERCYDCG